MADLAGILKGLEQWAGSRTPSPGTVPASMGALRASEAGALPAAPQTYEQQIGQSTAPLQAIQPTLSQMGQQYYSALSRGDIPGAQQIHRKANSLRQSIGMTPGADYDPATGYMKREGDVRPLGSINKEQQIAHDSFWKRMNYEFGSGMIGRPATTGVSQEELKANPYMNTPQANRYSVLANLAGTGIDWTVAQELTGGLSDFVGLGGTALRGLPWGARLAAGAGRGAVEGGIVSAAQRANARQTLSNILFGTLGSTGATAMETVPGLKNLPNIIGRPLGTLGGVSGAVAAQNKLSPANAQQNPLRAAAPLVLAELAMAALGGKGALSSPATEDALSKLAGASPDALANVAKPATAASAEPAPTARAATPAPTVEQPVPAPNARGSLGRLARAVASTRVATPEELAAIAPDRTAPAAMPPPVRATGLDALFEAAAKQEDIDPALLKAIAQTESGSDANVVSPAGAVGLMQFMPDTAKAMGIDPRDPSQSIYGAAKLLHQLLDHYNGDVGKAVAAYNAGEGAVDKYGGIPPFKETQDYVAKVAGLFKQYGSDIGQDVDQAAADVGQAAKGIVSKLKQAVKIKDASAGVSRSVKFSDPTDAALYLARQSQVGSASRETYLVYLRDKFHGVSDDDILKAGDQVVRESRKAMTADKESKTVKVKSTGVHPAAKALVNLAAQAAAPTPQQEEQAGVTVPGDLIADAQQAVAKPPTPVAPPVAQAPTIEPPTPQLQEPAVKPPAPVEPATPAAADPQLLARAKELSTALEQRPLTADEMTELQSITSRLKGAAAPETPPVEQAAARRTGHRPMSGTPEADAMAARTDAEMGKPVKAGAQKGKLGLLLQTMKADGKTPVEYHAVKMTAAEVGQKLASQESLGAVVGSNKITAALKALDDAGKGGVAIMRVEKGTNVASSLANPLGYGKDINEAVANISYVGKDGKPRPFAQEVLKSAKADSPLASALQKQMLDAQQATAAPTEGAAPALVDATTTVPAIADLVKQHGDQVMDALDKRVAGIDIDITGKNKAAILTKAKSLIEAMRHVGLPVEDATSALDELSGIKKSDFDDSEDYLSNLEDAKNELVSGIGGILDNEEIDPTKVTPEGEKIFRGLAPDNKEMAPDPATPAAQAVANARGLKQGDSVDASQIADDVSKHPDVVSGKVTAKQVFESLEKRGIDVQNKNVELHAGLSLPAAWRAIGGDLKKIYDSAHSRTTFKDISEIDGLSRSLSQKNLNKLPEDVQVTLEGKDGDEMEPRTLKSWLDKIDKDAANSNARIKQLLTQYGSEFDMPKEARESLDKARNRLDTADSRRETLRPAVEQALGEADKRPYSEALSKRIAGKKAARGFMVKDPLKETATYMTGPDGKPILDAYGKPVELGSVFTNPLTGKDVYLQRRIPVTYSDVSMLKTDPSVIARVFGVARDVFSEPVVRPLRSALTKMYPYVEKQSQDLYTVLKPVLDEYKGTARDAAMTRITYLLEGKDVPTAGELERTAATSLRGWYDQQAGNFGFTDAKKYLEDYSPHIRQAGGFVSQAFGNAVPQELRFASELERKLKAPIMPVGENALENAMMYLRAGSRRAFLQPALDEVEPAVNKMSPGRLEAWKSYTESILGRPGWDEKMIQGAIDTAADRLIGDVPESLRGRFAKSVSSIVTHLGYVGTMGLNAKTAMLRMIHGLSAVYTLDSNPLVGMEYFGKSVEALHTPEGKDALKYCLRLTQRGMYEGFNRVGVDSSGGNILKKIAQVSEKIGFAPFDAMDKETTKTVYMMQLLKSLDKGKPYSEAIEDANSFTNDTQGLYGIADSRAYARTPLGRMAGMMMSWPLNFARMLDKFGSSPGERMKAVNAFVGLSASCWGLSQLTGIDFNISGPTKTLERIFTAPFQGYGSPVMSSLVSGGQYLSSLSSNDATTRTNAYRQMMNNLGSFIPFYVEGKRAGTLATAAKHDWNVYNNQGELLYRFGDIAMPGAQPEHLAPPGGLVPEQVRSLLGPTMEQAQRSDVTDAVLSQTASNAYLRKQMYQIYMGTAKGDIDALQKKLQAQGGKPMTMSDIRTMEKTAQQEHNETYAQRIAQAPLKRGGHIQYPGLAQKVLSQLLGSQ